MESMGFVFGTTGLSFGMLGFIFAMAASNNAQTATAKVDDLVRRLSEAGILDANETTD